MWIRWIRIRILIRIRNTGCLIYNLAGYLLQLERLGRVDRQAGAEEAEREGALEEGEGEAEDDGDPRGEESQEAIQKTTQDHETKVIIL